MDRASACFGMLLPKDTPPAEGVDREHSDPKRRTLRGSLCVRRLVGELGANSDCSFQFVFHFHDFQFEIGVQVWRLQKRIYDS